MLKFIKTLSKVLYGVTVLLAVTSFIILHNTKQSNAKLEKDNKHNTEVQVVHDYLYGKHSPLAEYTELLLQQKHWRLLISISNIESQFCKRKLGYNCWGIGGDSHYKKYNSYEDAIVSANKFIETWQQKGKWLTVDSMNCSYVVPCSKNWVYTTKKTLTELNQIDPPTVNIDTKVNNVITVKQKTLLK